MKYLFFLFLLFPVLSFAQESSSKSSKAQFVVLGECEMCKDRIQRATYKIKELNILIGLFHKINYL